MLRQPDSPTALLANARQAARVARGRDLFVWRARVLTIGLPLGAALGVMLWRRRRESALVAAGAVAGAVALTYVEARLEWELRRRAHEEHRLPRGPRRRPRGATRYRSAHGTA